VTSASLPCAGNRAQFWLDWQSQYDIALVERERGAEIARRVHPADAAGAASMTYWRERASWHSRLLKVV
jgi:plasmid maintenance system antidote protein VapI